MAFFEESETTPIIDNSLWTERYRPRVLSDYIGNDHLKEKIAGFVESGDIPHLLLYGKAGTGKSTLAKIIINTIDCDYLFINASDENNVDTIRNKVKTFASSMGFKPFKIVVLDEADFLTPSAQATLRNLMETFSRHCRFVLTCNYVEKIIEPIQSRCQTFQIIPPSKRDIAVHTSQLLTREGISFEPKDLAPIINACYPDIRKVINTCQMDSIKGVLRVDTKNLMENDYKFKIIEILKSKDTPRNKYMACRQVLTDSRVTEFTELYTELYSQVDDYAGSETANVILILGEACYKSALVVDKEITAAATIVSIIGILP